MRILVTNDDGIAAEGLHVLAAAMRETEHDIVVAAPDQDMSGSGASIGAFGLDAEIDVVQVELPDVDVPAWSVAGPPGLCTIAAMLGAFGEPPDIVVSGVNPGLNTGRAILHSGTVGAALTAQNFGARGLAVSVKSGERWHFDTAARLAREVLEVLIAAPERSALNLNVPALPYESVRGTRWARLGAFGAVRAAIREATGDGRLQMELRATESEVAPDSDTALCADGYATITTLLGIAEAWPVGLAANVAVTETVVPGGPFKPTHEIPDTADHRTLHPRRYAP